MPVSPFSVDARKGNGRLMLHLYKTQQGIVARDGDGFFSLGDIDGWDDLVRRDDLTSHLNSERRRATALPETSLEDFQLLPPIGAQEIWAAGVTYYRSRDARMEESQEAGGGSFYDRVYDADRPELFFKATPHRVVGNGGRVRIRRDSEWNVPEPELTLVISAGGSITGYTVGNDVSSRDIEGENPLYLGQAKVYDSSAAVGPGLLITDEPLAPETVVALKILRDNRTVFEGDTTLARLKRTPEELVAYLYRESSYPNGCYLMTGTGVIPPSSFTLEPGDEVTIVIEPIGTLVNTVERLGA